MREKLVLIGAGSAVFTRGLIYDLIARGWDADVVLVDIDEKALAVAERLARKMIVGRAAPLRLSATSDRRQALAGATVIICTIGVGGRRAWEADVAIPRRYGVFQPVGDTVMPGGASRALRMIPAMVAIARDVIELAPSALFFNYGNPMAPVCRAVRLATGAPMIGLCHGVNHTAAYLAEALGCKHQELEYAAVGVNHLTWFVEARTGGGDAMARLRAIGKARGTDQGQDNPFSWRLCSLLGAFPAACDRHVVEFFPHLVPGGSYSGKRLGVDAFSFEGTIADGDRDFQEMCDIAADPAPLPESFFQALGGEHEQVTDIISDIRVDRHRIYSANLPNKGQVPNLPLDAVVESPCVVDGGTLKPIAQRPLSAAMAGVLSKQCAWVECVVDAALHGDRGRFVEALTLDGSVASFDAAEALADDLLRAQARFLPQFPAGAVATVSAGSA